MKPHGCVGCWSLLNAGPARQLLESLLKRAVYCSRGAASCRRQHNARRRVHWRTSHTKPPGRESNEMIFRPHRHVSSLQLIFDVEEATNRVEGAENIYKAPCSWLVARNSSPQPWRRLLFRHKRGSQTQGVQIAFSSEYANSHHPRPALHYINGPNLQAREGASIAGA